MKCDENLLSPAFTVCGPSKKNRQEPGQWFASIRVTVTPLVSGIMDGVSIGRGRTHFLSTESMWIIRFAVPSEQYIRPFFQFDDKLV